MLRVPVKYGDATRQVSTVLQQNSASALPSTPLITFYISSMDYDRPRIQEPYFVSNIQVRQRTYDSETDTYETTQGNAFTIERLMPVPYKMTITCDIWTSNTNQKFQLFEQIATLFNPALEVQSTENYIDWTSLSVVELESTTWSSRTIPQGTENPIDIMTMRFTLPIWISSPAKVKKLGVVEKIVLSTFDARGDIYNAINSDDLLLGTRQFFTPFGYQVLLVGNKLQVLKPAVVVNPPNGSIDAPISPPSNELWHAVLGMYGTIREGISQIRLASFWGDNTELVGTISYDPSDDRFLLYDIDGDTIPQNTLQAIGAVIDPLLSGPGAGLPVASIGQRYLILNDVGSFDNPIPPAAWGTLVAKANDIVEYTATGWVVSFEAGQHYDNTQFVTNITTGLQYRWADNRWVKSYEGLYSGGEWSLVL